MTAKLVIPETAQFTQLGGDPAAVSGKALVYSKPVGGVAQLFVQAGDGVVAQVGTGSGVFSPPERWAQVNVAASQTNVALSAQVSGNTNTIKMAAPGSIVGLITQLTEAVTAGTLTVTVTKNGTPVTLSAVHTSGLGTQVRQAVGVDTYVAGDVLGVQLTTNAGFLPITTDIEAWIQCSEVVAGTPGMPILPAIGGIVTGATDGSVLFASGTSLAQDNSNLYYDATSKRLGIGTNGPSTILDIAGAGNTAALALRAGASAAVSAVGTARLRFNQSTNKLQVSENGGAYADVTTGASFTLDIGDAIGSSTAGSVLFVGASNDLQQNNTYFTWNNTARYLAVHTDSATDGSLFLRSTVATGPAAAGFINSAGTFKSYVGYFNASYAFTHFANKNGFFAFTNEDIVLGNSTVAQTTFGMTATQAFMQMANGGSAAVSAASTGRLIYNTTGQKFQISANGGAYTDLAAPLALGNSIGGSPGTNGILYVGTGGVLAQTAIFGFDPTNRRLAIGALSGGHTLSLQPGTGDTAIQFDNGNSAAVSLASTGNLRYTTTGQKFQVSTNGGAYADIALNAASLTTGSVLFANSSGQVAQDNANLFFDDTNNRLGVGTATPDMPLDVEGLLGNTSAKFGNNRAIYMVADNATIGFNAYYNAGWVFGKGSFTWFAGSFGFDHTTATFSWATSGVNGIGDFTAATMTSRATLNGSGVLSLSSLTQGYILFAGASGAVTQDTSVTGSFYWDNSTKRLLHGTHTIIQYAAIDVTRATADMIGLRNTQAYSTTSGSLIYLTGDLTPTASGQRVGGITLGGWSGAGAFYRAGALFEAFAEGSWTAGTSHPTYVTIKTAATGSATPTERMRITAAGDVQITALTTGSILFSGASGAISQDNTNFFWDNTNKRLGIGTASPTYTLDIQKNAAFYERLRASGAAVGDSPTLVLEKTRGTNASPTAASANDILGTISFQGQTNGPFEAATIRVRAATGWGATGADSPGDLYIATTPDGSGTPVDRVWIDSVGSLYLTTSGTTRLVFEDGASAALSPGSNGSIRYKNSTTKFQASKAGGAYEDIVTVAAVALTDAANIATNAALAYVFTVTLGGNRTLDNPTNLVAGGVYRWVITQDGTGSRTLSYGTLFKWPGGTAPTLSTGAGAIDTITAVYDGTYLLSNYSLNYS